MLHFDSDYMRGAHPEILNKLFETNWEQTTGYGSDEYTAGARKLILEACGLKDAEVFFMVGGTQTNATVIDGILYRHQGVVAADTAHINVHEAGAVEATGHKVLTINATNGKLSASDINEYIATFYRDESHKHMVEPGMVYISFPTELGTIYTKSELSELYDACKKANIPLFIDGARLGYGLASEECDITLSDLARLCDVFYIGGTKVGAFFGEAIVITNPSLLPNMIPLMKQHGGLLAKGRLLGLQFEVLFTNDLYFKISKNAINMAIKMKKAFIERSYKLFVDSPTNQQFFVLPNELIDKLSQHATFELWGPRCPEETPVRFVTDWGTSEDEIDSLIKLID